MVERLFAAARADPGDGREAQLLWALLWEYCKRREGFSGVDALGLIAEYATSEEEAAYRLTPDDADRIVTLVREAIDDPAGIAAWQVEYLRKAQTEEALDVLLASLAVLRGEDLPLERRQVAEQIVNSIGEPGFLLDPRMLTALRAVAHDRTLAGAEARQNLPILIGFRANALSGLVGSLVAEALVGARRGAPDTPAYAVLWNLLEEYRQRHDGGSTETARRELRRHAEPYVAGFRLRARHVRRIVALLRRDIGDPANIRAWHIALLAKARTPEALDVLLEALPALREASLPQERRSEPELLVKALAMPAFLDDPRVRAALREVSGDRGSGARQTLGGSTDAGRRLALGGSEC